MVVVVVAEYNFDPDLDLDPPKDLEASTADVPTEARSGCTNANASVRTMAMGDINNTSNSKCEDQTKTIIVITELKLHVARENAIGTS